MVVSSSENKRKKINLGQFNTKKGVWLKPHIKKFILESKCSCVVDPFAGAGDLLNVVKEIGIDKTRGLDIDRSFDWEINNSLEGVPYYEGSMVVTNPPYLAKNSAARKGLETIKYFRGNEYTDLYQIAIDKVLKTYNKAVFIIPETFRGTKFFKDSIVSITILEENPFEDTDCPVCVVCFCTKNEYDIYKNDDFLFTNNRLEKIDDLLYVDDRNKSTIQFNCKDGNLGLRAIDGTNPKNRIKFCLPDELNYERSNVKHSSRAITILYVDHNDISTLIKNANRLLEEIRDVSQDVVLTPFKNNNREGVRRRRLDFKLARRILEKTSKNDI